MSEITAAITAVGGYVPDYVLTNTILETMVDVYQRRLDHFTHRYKERRILKDTSKATGFFFGCGKGCRRFVS